MSTLIVHRKTQTAKMVTKASNFSAGYDLYSDEGKIIPARSRCLVNTNLIIKLPDDTYGRIASRSGLSLKHGIEVGAGVIDEDYKGDIMVLLYNHSDVDYQVQLGDKIAQLIIEKIAYPEIVEVSSNTLPYRNSNRNDGGFGSSGY